MGVKDAKKAYVHTTNGLEGEREKKVRQEGSKGGEGKAWQRGAQGSPPASQGSKSHRGTATIFQVALQGKCVIWRKVGPSRGSICYQEGDKGCEQGRTGSREVADLEEGKGRMEGLGGCRD